MAILQVLACKSHLFAIQLKESVCFVFKTLTNLYSLANIGSLNFKYTRCMWSTVFSLGRKWHATLPQGIRKDFQGLAKARGWLFFLTTVCWSSLSGAGVVTSLDHHTLALAGQNKLFRPKSLCCPQGTHKSTHHQWLFPVSNSKVNSLATASESNEERTDCDNLQFSYS